MRLSVVIPNYNYARFVGAAIESALAIDWPDVEVIVVDDGSTDNSREIIEAFSDRITAIFQANATQRVACNAGFSISSGSVVIFLDSDDLLVRSIAREIAAVWYQGVSKVQFQMARVDQNDLPTGSVFPTYKPVPTPEKIRAWTTETTAYPTPPGSGNAYARSFLERIFPLDDECGDFSDSACLAVAPFFGDVVTVAKPLVMYRTHDENDSSLLRKSGRFGREIRRARARFRYAHKLWQPDAIDAIDELPLFRSLPLLQFRVAAFILEPAGSPLSGDSRSRALLDSIRVPLRFPADTRIRRLVVSVWAFATLLAPHWLAVKLVMRRYREPRS